MVVIGLSVNAQIVNGDLESWTSGEPDSWMFDFGGQIGVAPGTYNLFAGVGEAVTTTEITGAAAAGGSGSSAELETKDAVPGGFAQQNGINQIEGMLLGEWAFTGTPADFSFDVDAQPLTGDTAIVFCSLYDAAGDLVAWTGILVDAANATTGWTPVTVPFNYETQGTVTKIEIFCQSSIADVPVTGSILRVDNFAVSGDVTSVSEVFELNATVYPNPAINELNVSLNDAFESVRIISLDGKVVINETVNSTSTKLDVSGLETGAYIYEIRTAEGEVITNKFIKK